MGGETGDLVAETLGLDDGDGVDDTLVGVEVIGKPAIEHNQVNSQFTYTDFGSPNWVSQIGIVL